MSSRKAFLKTVFGFLILFSFLAEAKDGNQNKGQPLYFPGLLNNVQPLPQKFEFSIRDPYRFLIGNRIIDTSQFEFRLGKKSATQMQIDLRWPENLFEKGTLNILSPSGVSVWSSSITDQNNLNVPDTKNLLRKLLTFSFFKFCVGHYELNTGMEICSPEFFLNRANGKLQIKSKPPSLKPRIQINGKFVTDHGIVFLNDEKESLNFRALSASGAEFRMDTRSIRLDLLDVVSVNENLMALTIKGPFPLAPSQYNIVGEDVWTVTLKKDRALIYISGEGKVPLRQEFILQGPIPSEENRLVLEKSISTKVYSSNLELRGLNPTKGIPQAADATSEVAVTGDRFLWLIKNLSINQDKLSTIQVVDEKNIFTAGYTFSRALANRLELLGGFNTHESRLYLGGEGQIWFDSLPFLSRWTQQRLGTGFIYTQDMSGKTKSTLMELDVHWRLKKGLQLVDPSFYFGFGLQNFAFDSNSVQTFAPFAGWSGPSFKWLSYFDWQEFYLKQSLPAKTSRVDFKSRTELKWKLYRPIQEQRKVRYSVGVYTEEAVQKRTGGLFEAAWVMVF